jgi:hypothetical protein
MHRSSPLRDARAPPGRCRWRRPRPLAPRAARTDRTTTGYASRTYQWDAGRRVCVASRRAPLVRSACLSLCAWIGWASMRTSSKIATSFVLAIMVGCTSGNSGGQTVCDGGVEASCTGGGASASSSGSVGVGAGSASGSSGGGDGSTGTAIVDIAYSCAYPNDSDCQDITATGITAAQAQAIQDQCKSRQLAVFSASPCSTASRVGSCVLKGPAPTSINPLNAPNVTVTVRYYSPTWDPMSAASGCPSTSGMFTPG